LGGTDLDNSSGGLAVRDLSHVWSGGDTYSLDFPQTPDAYGMQHGGWGTSWIARFDLSGMGVTPRQTQLVPQDLVLRVFPNPFNSVITFLADIPAGNHSSLTLYNIEGRLVGKWNLNARSTGVQSIHYDASGLASGQYFLRLSSPKQSLTRKITLIK